MSSHFGFTVLFGLITLLLQKKVIHATASITIDSPCDTGNGDTCADGLVCEQRLCKYKNGTACEAAKQSSCVDGANCTGVAPGTCECRAGRLPVNAGNGTCAPAASPLAVGAVCTSADTCAANTVCETGYCKYKNGTDCSAHEDKCVARANCTATGTGNAKVCVCGTPAATNGTCTEASAPATISLGGDCTTGTCVAGSACDSTDHTCRVQFNDSCAGGNSGFCASLLDCDVSTSKCLHPAEGAAGGSCKSDGTCTTAGLVCENAVCRYKNSTDCSAHKERCVDGATCTTFGASKVCVCVSGRTPATSEGKCAEKSASSVTLASYFLIISAFLTSRQL